MSLVTNMSKSQFEDYQMNHPEEFNHPHEEPLDETRGDKLMADAYIEGLDFGENDKDYDNRMQDALGK